MAEASTEVPPQGLPQLNVIADGSYTNQVAWLALTFVFLLLIVSRIILPRVSKVMAEREEKVADDLDTAERQKSEAEKVKSAYEAAVAAARAKAQEVVAGAKDTIQADITKAQSDLDADLGAKAADAEARIGKARDEALAGIDAVAAEVAADMVAKLGGVEADGKAVSKAVKSALDSVKGA
ncbi:MAG: hypothetical protein JKY34_11425 [Kordiimonadaceae bacterium]|nr:hypothetical protein [Kordiimonadaceae bacterium]